MNSSSYKPTYTWPNPAFPFRVYLDDPRCRIFIIENIQHNWNWLKEYHTKFRSTDVFLVYCGWYHGPAFAVEADKLFRALGLNKSQFFFMFNEPRERNNFEQYGFVGDVINQNAWLDENVVMKPIEIKKKYRAIYVARRSAFKRHHLARNVEGLALVAGINHGNSVVEVPEHVYLNSAPLTPEEVCVKINESSCGLILSESEGACFSSSEYLLCGVPVVSTPSTGGRSVWYNDYNSIICEPTESAVADAVEEFVRNPRDPYKIRQMHMEIAREYRWAFIRVLGEIFARYNVWDIDPERYFRENFFHKMRKSYRASFQDIFG